jgi:hypothetical protein
MVFGLGNLYSLKCWSPLAALRTRAIQWAHATGVLSLEAEAPLRSLKASILREGCPRFVPSLPGRFLLKFESAGTQAACCLPSNDNAAEPVLSASIFGTRSPVKSMPAPSPDEVRNECSG